MCYREVIKAMALRKNNFRYFKILYEFKIEVLYVYMIIIGYDINLLGCRWKCFTFTPLH